MGHYLECFRCSLLNIILYLNLLKSYYYFLQYLAKMNEILKPIMSVSRALAVIAVL